MQIVNQAVIYELVPEARSRANSSYMTVFFIGGAVGSVSAGSVLAADGWTGISWLGAGFGALALAMALYERLRPSPALTPPPVAARPPAPVSPGRPGG
jgi:predicted MFS family arabinose efflux permease